MIHILVLDAIDALWIARRLCARHREEILRLAPDLRTWALSRVSLPGPQWAMEVDGQVMLIGGLIDQGDVATLWFAGAIGWERHLRPLLKSFRVLRDAALFKQLHCRVYEDNPAARDMVERLGFQHRAAKDGLISYGMTL